MDNGAKLDARPVFCGRRSSDFGSGRPKEERDLRSGSRAVIRSPMERKQNGFHEMFVPDCLQDRGTCLSSLRGQRVPDPASRFQPDDVHGPSEVDRPQRPIDGARSLGGPPMGRNVVYELQSAHSPRRAHFGAATKVRTPRGLGVTAIELMPVADFPGRWNWGYDGVLLMPPTRPTAVPRISRPWSTLRMRAASWCSSTSSTITSDPRAITCRSMRPILYRRHKTPWGAAINSMDATHSRCASSSSTTPVLARGVPPRRSALRRGACNPRRRPPHLLEELAARCARASRRPHSSDAGERGQ